MLSHAALKEAIGEVTGSLLLKRSATGTISLRLPSTAKAPTHSPELVVEEPPEIATSLKWWDIETQTFPAGLSLDMLLALPENPPYGIVYGSSLRFWTTVAKFAFELITKQAFIPTLQETKQGKMTLYQAVWQALLSHEDAERLNVLTHAMPPICWSFMPSGEKKVSLLHDIVQKFLDQSVDAFVRESLPSNALVSSRSSRKAVPEQWLRALSSENSTLSASPEELQHFAKSLAAWLEMLQPVTENAPFRTCFRLDTPETDEQAWLISFHLQANDDRSLLVPADDVWQERSDTLTFLNHKFENPQERLLTDLGRASRLFPILEESLKTAHPRELALSTEEAYAFLRQSAPLLEQSGFGVLVPPWWSKSSARLKVKLKLKPKSGSAVSLGLVGLDSIVAYDWNAAVGESELTEDEFARLVNLKTPLVQVRGQWVELRPEEIEAAISFFQKKRRRGEMKLGEALGLGLGQGMSETGLQVAEVEGEGWVKDLLDGLTQNVKLDAIDVPSTLQGTLRPYQLKGVSWLAFLKQFGLGACLADDMGMGKCLSKDSFIAVNGTLQKAEDIWKQYAGEATSDGVGDWANPKKEMLVNSIDDVTRKIVQTSIKHLYRQHVSENLRTVRLEDGNKVTITASHKLLTDKGWTSELHIGDYVCVPAKLEWQGKPEDPDLVKFLAWQIAEGYENGDTSTLSITQKDILILAELQSILIRLKEKYGIEVNNPSICTFKNRAAYLRLTSVSYRRFLRGRGYTWGMLSRDKCIPDFIMQADLDSIRIFLQNFFQAEASVVASMKSIEISTASPLLVQQLSYLLRRFGIWMRVSTKQKRATNGTGTFRPYQIGVLGGNAARKFCQEIGFAGSDKQKRLEHICEFVNNTNVEGIPASEIMAQTIATTKLPIRHFGMPTVYVYGSQQFSPASLRKVISACDSILSGESEQLYREMYGAKKSKWTTQTLAAYAQLDKQTLFLTRDKLQHLVDQEVYYCRIKEIENVQYDGWVYDFEVEKHHNFVANSILCHNTVQLITLLLHERAIQQNSSSLHPTLLVCPMSIVGNWQRELQKFAPSLKVMVHHGMERLSGQAFVDEVKQHDVVITTYSLALRDKEHLAPVTWEQVVIDEAQNIKNESAKQTQAIKKLDANYKIALTGTPVENRLSELWSIMEFLNPGYLGSGTEFHKNFATPIERYHNAERADALKRLTQPFILRRLKTDKAIIQDLPDKMEMKVFCNLTQEQASLYEAVVKDMLERIEEADGIERRGLVLATLMKLKQVCNHPAHFVGDGSRLEHRSGKLNRLEEMLEEVVAAGDKALIFTQFAEMGKLLRTELQERLNREVLFLHGGTPKQQRDIMVQRFQEERRGSPLFILSLKAGGVGLNLTAANHVFHFDRWWNPAVENQATDRAFRIGQKKNVQVHKFVCVGTLEERIDQMIEQKKELAESIIGNGENWLTEMSTSQLKELFALSREAVGE
ncbi:MAG: hypothetical protein NVSMB38_22950 [Ktedonobacteraceae bacterium]